MLHICACTTANALMPCLEARDSPGPTGEEKIGHVCDHDGGDRERVGQLATPRALTVASDHFLFEISFATG